MSSLNSNLKVQRNLFTRRYSWIYNASLDLSNKNPKELLRELIKILNPLLKEDSVAKNIKGRDRLNVIDQKLNLPFEHEILFCDFQCKSEVLGLNDQDQKTIGYYFLSPFDHYEAKDIYHKIIQSTEGMGPIKLELDSCLSNDEIHLQSFRVGLDVFGQSSFANWFFPTPVVVDGILLEFGAQTLSLRIQVENQKDLASNVLQENPSIKTIIQQLVTYSGFQLLSDLDSKLKNSDKPS